jgi:hypothetical protein
LEAAVVVLLMQHISERLQVQIKDVGHQFVVTYGLKSGLKKFGEPGHKAVSKEIHQLHDRDSWKPIRKEELSQLEKSRAMESLIFLVEKRDGTIKARHCANGSTQRSYLAREDTSSPTVSTEATLLTLIIEAKEGRKVITVDIPNAFIQTEHPFKDSEGNKMIMKIRGTVVDILCGIDPVYNDYVEIEKGEKVL